MDEPFERLQEARRRAGYKSPTAAARAYGWREVTYRSHENGTRGLTNKNAPPYALAYHVPVEWLLYGRGRNKPAPVEKPALVQLVGYVSAGAAAHFVPAGELDQVEAPADASANTVAVEIRGDSLGSFFDRWLVFYDDVHRPITDDLIGKLCVVGLADERVLIKKPQRSKAKGLFHLLSQTEGPILDVAIDWAAPVKHMRPR